MCDSSSIHNSGLAMLGCELASFLGDFRSSPGINSDPCYPQSLWRVPFLSAVPPHFRLPHKPYFAVSLRFWLCSMGMIWWLCTKSPTMAEEVAYFSILWRQPVPSPAWSILVSVHQTGWMVTIVHQGVVCRCQCILGLPVPPIWWPTQEYPCTGSCSLFPISGHLAVVGTLAARVIRHKTGSAPAVHMAGAVCQ